jgi:hypothetical protein
MPDVLATLKLANIGFERFEEAASGRVYLTTGHQLIGTYTDLRAFRQVTSAYHGWEAHHVVETQDLSRLNIAQSSPSRNEQLCVLLPKLAHRDRINGVLRSYVQVNQIVTAVELLEAYTEAYDVIGDYCGGGERLIQRELLAIVRATFKAFDLI